MSKTRNYLNNNAYPNMRKGLKKVHIGEDVWLIGKSSIVNRRKHQVIYGPNRAEYHVWDEDVEYINTVGVTPHDLYDDSNIPNIDRHGNHAMNEKVKIYILTNILDDKNNWCFDLTVKPDVGARVKTMYDNGSVRWIESFTGEFLDIQVEKWKNQGYKQKFFDTFKPVGYRK